MSTIYDLCKGMGLCVFLSCVMVACVNHVTEAEDEVINDGNLPLRFMANIREMGNSRVAGNEFETGDEVGLFALAGNTTLKEERYADNLHFTRSSENIFDAEEPVYYPDDEVLLNLFGYYPYLQGGIAVGESTMQVSVSPEQNIPSNYSHSDFLVAAKKEVSASKDAIPMDFKHKCFKLKIAITPAEGLDAASLLSANPELSVCGFYTKAAYDFEKDLFSQYLEEETIAPAGKWVVEGGRLVGKEVILIPQEATVGRQYVTFDFNGKTYHSFLPSTVKLSSGKQRELEIIFKPSQEVLMNKVNGEIADWEGDETDHTEAEVSRTYIDVSILSFGKSNVYKVVHAEQQVAEICKEYLVTSSFASQAIVAYPMTSGTQQVDLSRGTVVQLVGRSGNVHGGSVVWNSETNTLNYTSGTLSSGNKIYIKSDGQITLTPTLIDNVQLVTVVADMARDVRGEISRQYPIVKIGTQYWMRDNLETSLYNDGTKIPNVEIIKEGVAGFVLSKTGNHFYSSKAVMTNKLGCNGWSLPNPKDWTILKTYLKEDAALLKAGTWIPMEKETTLAPVNNLSGFNASPVGICYKDVITGYEGRYLGYWTLNDAGTTVDHILLLKSNNNDIVVKESLAEQGYSVRCIRK